MNNSKKLNLNQTSATIICGGFKGKVYIYKDKVLVQVGRKLIRFNEHFVDVCLQASIDELIRKGCRGEKFRIPRWVKKFNPFDYEKLIALRAQRKKKKRLVVLPIQPFTEEPSI